MSFGLLKFGLSPFGLSFGPSGDSTGMSITAAKFAKISSGDYISVDGNLEDSEDPIDIEVLWRLSTMSGSFSTDKQLGNDVGRVTILTPKARVEVADSAKRCLQDMVDRGAIKDIDVIVKPIVKDGLWRNAYSVSYTKTGRIER